MLISIAGYYSKNFQNADVKWIFAHAAGIVSARILTAMSIFGPKMNIHPVRLEIDGG